MAKKDQIRLEDVLSPEIVKEFNRMEKAMDRNVKKMAKLASTAAKLKQELGTSQLKDLNKTQQRFQKTQKESTKQQRKALTVQEKYEQKIKNLTKEEIRYKEQLRDKRKQLKREVQAENAAEDSVTAKRQELNRLNQEYDEASAKMRKKMLPQIKRLRKEISRAEEATGRHQRNVGNYAKSFQNAALKIGAMATAVVGAVRGIGRAISTFSDFEKQIDRVAAVSGATDEQVVALRQSAINLGSTTTKTAGQVGQLQQEFAKLGFTTNEILNATEATIRLSEVADADLGESAKVAAATLNGFGLAATETQRVVDVMAKSFTSSALDLKKFTNAMNKVAPVAKNTGFTIEETTAMIGKLTDAGVRAETAGTQLRNIFLTLAKSGMSYDEALTQIQDSTNKNATALELFGKRAAPIAQILAENEQGTERLTTELKNASGAAADMSKQMQDNLQGDLKRLQSAWEGFVLSIENGTGIINNALRGIVQWTTRLIRGVTNLEDAEARRVEKLREVKREANEQIEVIKTANFNDKQRKRAIRELNEEYGEYLPNLIDEKANIKDITDAQKELNKQVGKRILSIQFEKELKDIMDAQRESAESNYNIRKKQAELQRSTDGRMVQEQQQQLENIQKLNQTIIDNTEQRISALRDKYKQLAKDIGVAWNEIMATSTETNDQQEDNEENVRNALQNYSRLNPLLADNAEKIKEIGDAAKAVGLPVEDLLQFYDQFNPKLTENAEVIGRIVRAAKDAGVAYEKLFRDPMGEKAIGMNMANQLQSVENAQLQNTKVREQFLRDFQNKVKQMDRDYLKHFATMKSKEGEIARQELEKRKQQRRKWAQFGINQAKSLAQSIFKFQRAELQNEKQMAIEKARARGASEEEIEKINKKFAKKRKQQAVKEAIMNGALAVTNALATTPFPANLVAAALIAAKTAFEVATIKAQEFWKGTDDSPEGLAWVGERGEEGIVYPDGSTAVTPGEPTLTYLPKHSQVIPNDILQRDMAMAAQNREPARPGFDDSRIVNAIKNKKEHQWTVSENGISVISKNGNSHYKHLDRKFRGK